MSQQLPTILFLGRPADADQIRALIKPFGGHVYTPHALLDTLGMVITYEPDLVLLDASDSPDLADQVALHLESIDVHPVIIHQDQELHAALADLFPQLALPPERIME